MRFEDEVMRMLELETPSMWDSASSYVENVPDDERARDVAVEVLISGFDNDDYGIWENWFQEFRRNGHQYPLIDIETVEDLMGVLYYAKAVDPDTGAMREGSDILVGAKYQQPDDISVGDVADGVAALLYEIHARAQERGF